MTIDIVLNDPDQNRDYHVSITYRCRPEIGGSPSECLDINRVSLESCTVWLAKCGMEVRIDTMHLRAWERQLEIEFEDEIRAACFADYEARRCVA
jgi:hypothetical protein